MTKWAKGFLEETKVIFDTKQLELGIKLKCGKAQEKLDAQVLNDSNYFCPEKDSPLHKSAIIYTVIGSGQVIWRTPYARKQYYGENLDHSKSKNPNACAKWFEAAKARWLKDWIRLVEDEIKRR